MTTTHASLVSIPTTTYKLPLWSRSIPFPLYTPHKDIQNGECAQTRRAGGGVGQEAGQRASEPASQQRKARLPRAQACQCARLVASGLPQQRQQSRRRRRRRRGWLHAYAPSLLLGSSAAVVDGKSDLRPPFPFLLLPRVYSPVVAKWTRPRPAPRASRASPPTS